MGWVAFPPPGDLPNPAINPSSYCVSCTAGRLFTTEPPGKPLDIQVHDYFMGEIWSASKSIHSTNIYQARGHEAVNKTKSLLSRSLCSSGKIKQTCRYVKHVKIHTISNANICNRPKWIKKGGRGPHLMRRGWQYKQGRWHFNTDPQRAREGGHRSIQKNFLGRESSKCKSPKAGTGNGAGRTAEEQGKGATRLGGGGNHSVVRPLTCLCLLLRKWQLKSC